MRVASALVLAVAALTSSATAASLDVEPVETSAPVLQGSNSSTNATNSSGKIGILDSCGGMWNADWDNYKYACEWSHEGWLGRYYNLFYMRFDGSRVKECDCGKGLWRYNPWGPRWTFSAIDSGRIVCFSRDGKKAGEVKRVFDNYSCE